ncbi:FAD-dependent oxidoreductase [Flavicella sediminum]|uniref:FAD-dependent oxidoreductase n=1 Tax=Flavicella sediminum TaxID=2585141 RepID=UPI00111CEA20|nr:FAD-dependent oxidoreductase [Flavicella sediminum]
MKRRDFFKKGAQGAVAASIIPMSAFSQGNVSADAELPKLDNWQKMGSDKKGMPKRNKDIYVDVLVAGGGVAGCCAAVSAARNGAKTILVQDRPVLGGNASSEIRVHLNGVTHLKGGHPERETGVVEEILLANRFRNPQESWHVWDHVVHDYVTEEPNLKVYLNTQAIEAKTKGDKIKSVKCWQSTTEMTYTIYAKQFIDCSGDGLMAATAGALYRTGREGKAEFNEKYAPDEPDGWQMGSTLMFSTKDMGKPMPFEAPHYAIPFKDEQAEKSHRKIKQFKQGFWWVEVGSDDDIIAEADEIRHRLMGHMYGVWDYIKNSGNHPESENIALDWVASLPGRRESRRFMGDYVLTEQDLLNYRHFEDAVGYGGWSLDEHNPGGIENLQDPPSFFHFKFGKVYEIPFRSLYSHNISNLLFAGRNISVSHIALSSTRLQGTCATMGQAVGTAAALCLQKGINPRTLREKHIDELQEQLLRDDAYIPNRPSKDEKDLAKQVATIFASSTSSGEAKLLTNGYSRDVQERKEINHWQSEALPADVVLEWNTPQEISHIAIKCDTNTRKNLMLRHNGENNAKFSNRVPPELIESLSVEARVNGQWQEVGEIKKNKRRLIKFSFDPIKATAIKVLLKTTYGEKVGRLYEVSCYK